MSKKRTYLIVAILVAALMGSLTAGAQEVDKFAMNKAAWDGITFRQLFGNPRELGKPPSGCPNCPDKVKPSGIALCTLVDTLKENLTGYKATLVAGSPQETRVGEVLALLGQLQTHLGLSNSSVPANSCLRTWSVRSMFEDDLEAKFPGTGPVKQAYDFMRAIQGKGLIQPWLNVALAKTNVLFLNLVYDPRFLNNLGKYTYGDFFRLNLEDVSDDTIDLTQEALKAQLFAELQEGMKASNSCCDRTTRKCRTYSSLNCSMCGSYCCLASQWCP